MKALLPRLLLSLALAIDATLPGALLLNWLYPIVDQGLAGGAIVVFRSMAVGIGAGVLAFLLYPLLPPKVARWALYLLGFPALILLVLLVISVRQSKLEQSAHLNELVAQLPPFKLYLANSEHLSAPPFVDIDFDSGEQQYTVQYAADPICTGDLPPMATQKMQLLQALRGLEVLLYEQPAPCQQRTEQWLYSMNFEIHDSKPPHTQYSVLLDQACLEQYPEMREAIEVIEQVHDDLKHSEHCE